MALTQDSRIIFVHGLASKPPQSDLDRLWRKALLANVRIDSPALARDMEGNPDLFRSGYCANAVPDHIEDTPALVRKLDEAVDGVIAARKKAGDDLHISRSGWASAKLKKFGLNVVDALSSAITIKDDVIEENLREVRFYQGDQYIADRIRARLEDELRDAWRAGKRVVIISHSMGTFIAYDVLWRFSHRSEDHYRKWRRRKADLLITMGSPLGDATLRGFMLIERWKSAPKAKLKAERRRFFPTNVLRWHNYSAYGDVVCHDATLEDDFFEGMREHVGGYGRKDLRDYVKLYNPYRNRKDKANPHKSYGYLIQPKLSQKLRQFYGVD